MKSKLNSTAATFSLACSIASCAGLRGVDAAPTDTLQAFLSKNCIACHGSSKQAGGLRLDRVGRLFESPQNEARLAESGNTPAELWHSVLERLASREMPPEDHPQPTDEQRDAAIRLARHEFQKAFSRFMALGEWAFPSHGNALPHEWLFPPKDETNQAEQSRASSPTRIWRISPQVYRQNVDELTRGYVGVLRGKVGSRGNAVVPSPFGLTTDPGFRDYAFRYRVAGSEVEQIARNAQMTIELMLDRRGSQKPAVELSSIVKGGLSAN